MTPWLLFACARPSATAPDPGTPPAPTAPTSPTSPPDPFAPQPETGAGLVDVSADLDALLEHGELVGACDRWRASPDDRRLTLLCGKSMFFYEGFGTLGIPAPLYDALPELFADEVGPAYTNFGLVPHPSSPEGRPIGVAPGAPLEDVETLALTCASCHFGPLPDGRYAVGAPNHGYDYGRHMLSLFLVPQAAVPGFDPADHDPNAIRAVQPMLDALDADPGLAIQLGLALLPLVGLPQTGPSVEQEGQYASWPPGTMDFVIAPLPVDDGVHTVSRILALWGMPTPEEQSAAGMPSSLLAWSGGAESLDFFLEGFVQIGGGDVGLWTEEALAPLREYVLSLRPPVPLDPGDPAEVARGEAVFVDAGCLDCHGGPRGSGTRVYTFEEIGTDAAMAAWADPDLDGTPCCGLGDAQTELTHGIKSPRLAGGFASSRFLHNGSLGSLEELLCLEARPADPGEPWSTAGHTYGCELPEADRRSLLTYLDAH